MNRLGSLPCDVCGKPAILVEHHIMGRDVPNPNHRSNLANVCPNCHMGVHSGTLVIERWVGSTSGTVLAWHRSGERSLTGDDSTPYQIGGDR